MMKNVSKFYTKL